jgi:hypothetical protein
MRGGHDVGGPQVPRGIVDFDRLERAGSNVKEYFGARHTVRREPRE